MSTSPACGVTLGASIRFDARFDMGGEGLLSSPADRPAVSLIPDSPPVAEWSRFVPATHVLPSFCEIYCLCDNPRLLVTSWKGHDMTGLCSSRIIHDKELRDRLNTWRKRMGAQLPTRKPTG